MKLHNKLLQLILLLSAFIFILNSSSCKKDENKDPVMPSELIGEWIDYGSGNPAINNRFTITATTVIWYQWVEGFSGDGDECDLTEVYTDDKVIYTNCGLYYIWHVEGNTLYIDRDSDYPDYGDNWWTNNDYVIWVCEKQ